MTSWVRQTDGQSWTVTGRGPLIPSPPGLCRALSGWMHVGDGGWACQSRAGWCQV